MLILLAGDFRLKLALKVAESLEREIFYFTLYGDFPRRFLRNAHLN